ncbi:MAG: methylglyoxal synthase [archaeon]|nr:methylglyoxal synthase [archaeon]MCP8306587.1 methylglyoxal synthase [archaeon]
MNKTKIVLVAHDSKKKSMVEWVAYNKETLRDSEIWATESTGRIVMKETDLPVNLLLPGPFGGDAQVGAMAAEGKVDAIIFFWDPLTPQAHDVDVKALLRLAVLHDVPIACNRSTADFFISSSLFRDCKRYMDERKKLKISEINGMEYFSLK